MKALLLENIHPEGVRLLTERGIEVKEVKGALDEAELITALPGVQLLGIRSKTNVTASVLDASPELQAIGAFCIGTNQVDLTAAATLGIPVFNAPFSNTRSVVELVIAEIIALARHLTDKNAGMHAGVWDKSAKGAHEVRGRTLGIVGYGNIGRRVAEIARGFGMEILIAERPASHASVIKDRVPIDDLFRRADVVSLHCPLTPETRNLINRRSLSLMKPTAFLINTARGALIDEAELVDALGKHLIGAAALDVISTEPPSSDHPIIRAAKILDNLIVTPHTAWSAREARERLLEEVKENIAAFLRGEPRNLVA